MLAEVIFAAFGLLATIGFFSFASFVARRTNNRLSGWVAYFAVIALPGAAYVLAMTALVSVLWERVG